MLRRRTAERSSAGDPSDAKAEARATHQRESSADKDKYHQRRLRPDVFATSGACVQMLFATSGACVQMLHDLTTMQANAHRIFFYSENTDNQRRLRSEVVR